MFNFLDDAASAFSVHAGSHRRVNTYERYIIESEMTTVCISKVPVRKQILKIKK